MLNMNRKDFLKIAGIGALSVPAIASIQKLNELSKSFSSTSLMPILFLGHGSPMNGIEDNEFVQSFKKIGQRMEKPNAILVVSAHWETNGTYVTAMENPRTIHDFGGFPKALYEVQYPAPGHPELAKEIQELIQPKGTVLLDNHEWGLDHGSWTVVKHLYPNADIPVIQMSIDRNLSPLDHYQLAQQLSALRKKGVLLVGSGNNVHNLRRIAWDKMNDYYGFDWALEANSKMKKWIKEENHQPLINFRKQGVAFDLSIPTTEHYIPLLYILGAQNKGESIEIFNDKPLGGSLAMTSVAIGL